jgi:ubiquinone/menaquinone biosynthesis C-methylase UbiE
MEKTLPNKIFYDKLASDYDAMISFDKAVENKKVHLKNLITSAMKFVADIGCGSGVDSIALASLVLNITAFDPSSEMLKAAKTNSKMLNVKMGFHNYSADNIPTKFNNNFDLVISLGNTFANIPKEKFSASLQRCYEILRPKGQLLIQVLNYHRILLDKQRIVNITEGEKVYFIRFNDFGGDELLFNVLSFVKSNPSNNKLISTNLYPHLVKDFAAGLKMAGFSKFQFYSDLKLKSFNEKLSKDLIIQAFK